ncbi:hypothetical protein [uncultured Mucilaginibacter sp.]|nr:hypothetical protein [uncultured Mucilaginibacter sp.]
MKNAKQNTESKLMKQFDLDLRNLLLADLKAHKRKSQFISKQLNAAA